jgi:hypothetical protein
MPSQDIEISKTNPNVANANKPEILKDSIYFTDLTLEEQKKLLRFIIINDFDDRNFTSYDEESFRGLRIKEHHKISFFDLVEWDNSDTATYLLIQVLGIGILLTGYQYLAQGFALREFSEKVILIPILMIFASYLLDFLSKMISQNKKDRITTENHNKYVRLLTFTETDNPNKELSNVFVR